MPGSRLTTVFLPAAVTTAFVILFLVWVLWTESTSPPVYIEGRVDNAPVRGGAILLLLTPFLFGFLLAGQALACKFSRGRLARLLAIYAGGILLVAVGMALLGLSQGEKLSKASEGFLIFSLLGLCLSLPMALTTWWAFRRR